MIGVERYVYAAGSRDLAVDQPEPTTERRQIARLQRIRRDRDNAKVNALLDKLVTQARDESQNLLPVTIDLVRAGASMGDIVEKLKGVWGTYRERPVF